MDISEILIAIGIIALMFLPTIIVFCDRLPHKLRIFILNIVLGRKVSQLVQLNLRKIKIFNL